MLLAINSIDRVTSWFGVQELGLSDAAVIVETSGPRRLAVFDDTVRQRFERSIQDRSAREF